MQSSGVFTYGEAPSPLWASDADARGVRLGHSSPAQFERGGLAELGGAAANMLGRLEGGRRAAATDGNFEG